MFGVKVVGKGRRVLTGYSTYHVAMRRGIRAAQ
jgi:hypothetical protein